tara:strand:+ start:35 stop:193 length:159 start_codon:yes stop_codon:yes gene_type:complete
VGKLVVMVTIARKIPGILIVLWLCYIMGMAVTEMVCDCTRELNGWWAKEYWQ